MKTEAVPEKGVFPLLDFQEIQRKPCFSEHPRIGIQFTADSRVNLQQLCFIRFAERLRPAIVE